jgi:hypothetical protein
VLVHRLASGQEATMEIMEAVHLRDAVGHQMAMLEPADLVRMAIADHERTIAALRSAAPKDLRREGQIGDGVAMSAEDIARLPLVSHLEIHLDQLEKLLAG